MGNFTFNEKEHLYELDGKALTGITTILKVVAKPSLIQWAANMAVDYIANNFSEVFVYPLDKEKIGKLLEEARFAHRRKKEEAGQKGIDVHTEIERIIKDLVKSNSVLKDGASDNPQIQHFINWAIINKVKFLASEKRLYSKKYWVAGTADFICEIDGKKYVGDLKTSSGIYDRTPFFQTAGYRMMLEEMGEKDFVGTIIINIKKSGEFDENKDVYCSCDYQNELDGFLACLTLYRKLQEFSFERSDKVVIKI